MCDLGTQVVDLVVLAVLEIVLLAVEVGATEVVDSPVALII